MRLGLSSDAARDAPAADLLAICRRRGLSALEITAGAGANVVEASALTAQHADTGSVALVGLLIAEPGDANGIAALTRRVGAPAIVASDAALAQRIRMTNDILDADGEARVLVRGNAADWIDIVVASGLPFSWQIDDTWTDPPADAAFILQRVARIEYVRLVGGGPETALQEGRGVGAVMRTLALSGYSGPLILTPSSQRFRVAWSAWLGRRGGWGCGSAAQRTAALSIES